MALLGRLPVQRSGLCLVLLHAHALLVADPEIVLRVGMALLCRLPVQLRCLGLVHVQALSTRVAAAEKPTAFFSVLVER
jgi:hypothetical protein